ncbi:MAG: hypothetical protein D6696_18760 [Acidobacteria bacterium]|nr:MAG: hypothetical protein D6696_18760 [Acidobacteriota bacterium]
MLKPELVNDLEPIEVVGEAQAQERICVFTIHDGSQVPRRVLGDDAERILDRADVRQTYLRERDWGADLVAAQLAGELGLASHLRVRLARVLLDYGRFPGVSENGEPYEERKSIYPPIAGLLPRIARHRLITDYFDRISRCLAARLTGAQVTLAVHTYDAAETRGADRPEVRLLRRTLSFPCQATGEAFDRLFPPVLCASTCNKSLMFQTVLNGAGNGGDVAPYLMPHGSVEMRVQVWFFFRFLRARFTDRHPATAAQPAFQRVWAMLLDVTRRSSDCELLRGYLHDYREAPAGQEALFAGAQLAYDEIADFLRANESELVDGYRFSTERPSCIGVEVRKDLLYDVDPEAGHVRPRRDAADVARDVARQLAPAVRDHLEAYFPHPVIPAAPAAEPALMV